MKSIIHAVIAALVSIPLLALAQSNAPVTRAEVRSELTQLERAGYSPANDEADYPANLQAAQARVAVTDATRVVNQTGETVNNSGYGGSLPHSSETGTRSPLPGDRNSIHFGD